MECQVRVKKIGSAGGRTIFVLSLENKLDAMGSALALFDRNLNLGESNFAFKEIFLYDGDLKTGFEEEALGSENSRNNLLVT